MSDRPEPAMDLDGLPRCTENCPQHDGKRCRLLGLRPSEFCEPALEQQREALATANAEAAALLECVKRRCPDHDLNHMDGNGCSHTNRELAALSGTAGRELLAEVERLRGALELIADGESDPADVARAALKPKG